MMTPLPRDIQKLNGWKYWKVQDGAGDWALKSLRRSAVSHGDD